MRNKIFNHKTAVFRPLHLLLCLLPLLLLGWTMRLMAQEPSLPEGAFIIPHSVVVTSNEGDDALRVQFVGLLPDGKRFADVTEIDVQPQAGITGTYLVQNPITVTSLRNEPFYLTVLVDTSGSMAYSLPTVKRQLRHFIANLPADVPAQLSIVGFNGEIREEQFVAFTSDRAAWLAQIDQLNSQNGSTCLNDVLHTAVSSLSNYPQNTRRAILLFTDGFDELIREQPEPCSEAHTYEDATALASRSTDTLLPIPIYPVVYPALGLENNLRPLNKLDVQNSLFATDALTRDTILPAFDQIIDSFTHQWLATIELYTRPVPQTLYITARPQNVTLPLLINPNFAHYPDARSEDVNLQTVIYDEINQQFNIEFDLCNGGETFCDPALITHLDLLIEDTFTHQLFPDTFVPGDFNQNTNTQTINFSIDLAPEHVYLMRLTARNGVTAENYEPFAEAYYAYQPQLIVDVQRLVLDRFALRPDLVATVQVTRTAPTQTIVLDDRLLEVKRPLFTDLLPRPVEQIEIEGHLQYIGADSRDELYPLTWKEAAPKSAVVVTFTNAAGGGYAPYLTFLTITDPTDDVTRTLRHTEPFPEPAHWWGKYLLQPVRAVLAEPALYVAAILLSLLLLGLIWLAAWTARRMIPPPQPAPPPAAPPERLPASLYVEASPDRAVRHQTYPLSNGAFIIGQRPEHDLTVKDDQLIAEKHAEVQQKETGFYLVNLDPDHSTYINNREIISHAPIPIHHGDKIRLGAHTRLTFSQPDSESASQPVSRSASQNGHGSDG